MLMQFRFGNIPIYSALAIAMSPVAGVAIAQESTFFEPSTTQFTSPSTCDFCDFGEPAVASQIGDQKAAAGHQPSPFIGPLLERTKLTGDWLGGRSALAGRGITADVSNTQFYQGVTRGGLEQEFRYGGRIDYFLNVNGEKAGLWKGAFITLHGETRYGEAANTLPVASCRPTCC